MAGTVGWALATAALQAVGAVMELEAKGAGATAVGEMVEAATGVGEKAAATATVEAAMAMGVAVKPAAARAEGGLVVQAVAVKRRTDS